MNDRCSVKYGDTTIEYEIRRSARRKKTMQIKVDRGAVRVLIPDATTDDEAREFVLERAKWIVERLAKQEARPEIRFVSGETLPYLGEDVELIVETTESAPLEVQFERGRFFISSPDDFPDLMRRELVQLMVMNWYRDRAEAMLPEYVGPWLGQLGRGKTPRILIRNQKRRWGSCSTDGTLRFNWRLAMLEPPLIEYVAVHELAHLTHMNHSKRFWGLVARVMPDMERRRKRLNEVGETLPFW